MCVCERVCVRECECVCASIYGCEGVDTWPSSGRTPSLLAVIYTTKEPKDGMVRCHYLHDLPSSSHGLPVKNNNKQLHTT